MFGKLVSSRVYFSKNWYKERVCFKGASATKIWSSASPVKIFQSFGYHNIGFKSLKAGCKIL